MKLEATESTINLVNSQIHVNSQNSNTHIAHKKHIAYNMLPGKVQNIVWIDQRYSQQV